MLLKKYSHYFFRYLLILFCFLFIFIRNADFASSFDDANILNYFTLCFGGVPATSNFDLGSISLYLISNLIVLFCFSDFFKHDCLINYVYVFTRRGNKKTWLFKKTLMLLLNLISLFLIMFIFAFVIGKCYNLQFDINVNSVISILSMLLLNAFSIFVLSFIQNFISLRIGIIQSFIIEIIYYVFCIVVSLLAFNANNYLNIVLFSLIPSNQMYLWHTSRVENDSISYIFGNTLIKFKLAYSYIILSLYAILTYFIAKHVVNKLDLAELIKEN